MRNAESRCAGPFRMRHSAFRIAGIALLVACTPPRQSDAERVTVTIPRGATFDAAVESLTARGVVTSPAMFRTYARIRGLPRDLKSGVYSFEHGARWGTVVNTLRVGRSLERRLVVPEGLMLTEVAEAAYRQLGIPRDSFLAAARAPEHLAALGIASQATTVEGYLFPTTYTVPVNIGAHALVGVMVGEFRARWSPRWQPRLDSLGLTRHEAVILASIVQAEMRYRPDAPYIAAVYHNRLRRGMRLQADPTVIYAHGRRLRRVWEKNLQINSPYNTYRHAGLPPGPISQPGEQALAATLFPTPAPFLYFVARPDGKHVFSVTYAEHLRAIRDIRRRR